MSSNQEINYFGFCSLDDKNEYSIGKCIKTKSSDDVVTTADDFLRFPQFSNSYSSCVYDSTLKFLNEGRSFCNIEITKVIYCFSLKKILNYYIINFIRIHAIQVLI